jgi:hypothetical protein
LSLPGSPRPEILQRTNGSPYLAQQRDTLLREFAASSQQADAQSVTGHQLFLTQLSLTATALYCDARYLTNVGEYETILALMVSMACWATTA